VSGPTLFAGAAVILLLLLLVYIHRVAVGPTVFDRILGVNGLGMKATVALLLLGASFDRVDMVVDVSLGYAILSFVGSLAAARYFERSGQPR
jgi:multicomponent Na+:H+ antiporter subunit F